VPLLRDADRRQAASAAAGAAGHRDAATRIASLVLEAGDRHARARSDRRK
ncbi:UDP-N-acetylglucosamine--N-acetylmuramyl-(pentapeptide) pyrophosphoryl-undecaprenol N-acetylglucosamine transferase, partial [Corynebacterium bovis]